MVDDGNTDHSPAGSMASRGDTRWLSYDDLVEVSGIKRSSVTRMVRRKKWPKRNGNGRGVRVEVPTDAIDAMQAKNNARPLPLHPPLPKPPAPGMADQPDLQAIARAVMELEAAFAEVRAERDELLVTLDQERAAAAEYRETGEWRQNEIAAIRMDRNQVQATLDRERSLAREARQAEDRRRAIEAADDMRLEDQRNRLTAQVTALAAEVSRLHALPRSSMMERPIDPTPLMSRVASVARWLRSS